MDTLKYTPAAQRVVNEAEKLAIACNHMYVGTEHILLAICLRKEGIAYNALRKEIDVENFYHSLLEEIYPSEPQKPFKLPEFPTQESFVLYLKTLLQLK